MDKRDKNVDDIDELIESARKAGVEVDEKNQGDGRLPAVHSRKESTPLDQLVGTKTREDETYLLLMDEGETPADQTLGASPPKTDTAGPTGTKMYSERDEGGPTLQVSSFVKVTAPDQRKIYMDLAMQNNDPNQNTVRQQNAAMAGIQNNEYDKNYAHYRVASEPTSAVTSVHTTNAMRWFSNVNHENKNEQILSDSQKAQP